MGSTVRIECDKREMSVTGRLAKRPVPDKRGFVMNARERCRAKRHAARQNERMIAAATGSNSRSTLPQSIYTSGSKKESMLTAR